MRAPSFLERAAALSFQAPDPFEYQRQVAAWVMRICAPGSDRVQRELIVAQVPVDMAALVASKAQVCLASRIADEQSLERRRAALQDVPEAWLPSVRTMMGDFYAARRAGKP